MARAIGIDLGTTKAMAAVLEDGEPTVVADAEGVSTTPSIVAFEENGRPVVGGVAFDRAKTTAQPVIPAVLWRMGVAGRPIHVGAKTYAPQQISAFVLQKLKRDAEAHLGEPVTDVVIAAPARFNDHQRQAVEEAARIAGMNVLRIISASSAAGLAHHLATRDEATVLVFDLGGGTLDISVLEMCDGVVEVKAVAGGTLLGGDDWDDRIVDRLIAGFRNKHGIDPTTDDMALRRLREAAERAKIELSGSTETKIVLRYLHGGPAGLFHLEETLTRARFQELTADLLERCKEPFRQVLEDAWISVGDIDRVILAGGSTRMPAIVALVRELSGKEPERIPEESIAVGAALQAGVLKGEVKDVLPLDVTPLSLGIETEGGAFTKVVERNTMIPTRHSETFSTHEDGQSTFDVCVYQGEREIAAYNEKLGAFQLTGLPPAPRGVPQIEVTFDIDANGIVNVSAKDLGTGKEQSMVISGGSALPKDDIERMTREAEQYAEEDRRNKE
ncbi:molecular chaperone DnaK [Actinocorallia libanotica]|uniref:Molecular chaperone DnaK n=1 Tax=Actinocorallia libanotica TaxID=46162 RepID=A0ABN1RDX4_9ACTN